jgi:hypothetical protein
MPSHLTRRHLLTLAGAAALSLPALAARAIIERPTSVLIWEGGGPFFGGFSALELTADRMQALAVSDRGFAVRARLVRDAAGRLIGIEKMDHFPLRDEDGGPVQGRRADSEGMDLDADGHLTVSFEGGQRSRVMRYTDARSPGAELPAHPDWAAQRGNGGLEALAVDASGAVFTIPESARGRAFPLYRHDRDGWNVVALLPALDGFEPVGADFGPDGALYLLERKFRMAFFATRISRLRPRDWARREILVETGYGVLDNHEGISITRDPAGQLWATTISDDNQNRFQRTEIAEFPLPQA